MRSILTSGTRTQVIAVIAAAMYTSGSYPTTSYRRAPTFSESWTPRLNTDMRRAKNVASTWRGHAFAARSRKASCMIMLMLPNETVMITAEVAPR